MLTTMVIFVAYGLLRRASGEAHVCTEPPKGVPPHMPKHNDMKLIKMTVYNLTIEINYQVQCKYCDSDVRRCV